MMFLSFSSNNLLPVSPLVQMWALQNQHYALTPIALVSSTCRKPPNIRGNTSCNHRGKDSLCQRSNRALLVCLPGSKNNTKNFPMAPWSETSGDGHPKKTKLDPNLGHKPKPALPRSSEKTKNCVCTNPSAEKPRTICSPKDVRVSVRLRRSCFSQILPHTQFSSLLVSLKTLLSNGDDDNNKATSKTQTNRQHQRLSPSLLSLSLLAGFNKARGWNYLPQLLFHFRFAKGQQLLKRAQQKKHKTKRPHQKHTFGHSQHSHQQQELERTRVGEGGETCPR